MLKRAVVAQGYLLRETNPPLQTVEVLQRFDLFDSIVAFRRCMHCNALLEEVPIDLVSGRLPPNTRRYYDEFHICPECKRIYWKGSHYQRMQKLIQRIVQSKIHGAATCIQPPS